MVEKVDCDVLVVGGGPAGCSAAAGAAEEGMDTVLIEKEDEIGKPVECAEGIGSYLLPLVPFDIPDELLEWRIDGMKMQTRDHEVTRRGALWRGWSLDREKWDKWLAKEASDRGVEVMTGTELVSVDRKSRYGVMDATADRRGETVVFEPDYVIAADGSDSTVARLLGLPVEDFVKADVVGYEARCEIKDPRLQYFFFEDFSPNGYAYIFPKSEEVANIGVGCTNTPVDKLEEYFSDFLESEDFREVVDLKELVTEKGGEAPMRYPGFDWNYGNVFFVGDAANQAIKPFEEGNIPSIICGWLLGKNLVELYKEGNYREYLDSLFMGMQTESRKVSEVLETLTPAKYLVLFADFATLDDVLRMRDSEAKKLARKWNSSKIFRAKEEVISKIYHYLLEMGLGVKRRKLD